MVFSSLSECISYVRKAQRQSAQEIAKMQEKEMKQEVYQQVYNSYCPSPAFQERWGWHRTYATYNNIRAYASGHNVELVLHDTGVWHSVYPHHTKVYAFDTLEAGTTWGRGATNIEGTIVPKLATKTPQVYKSAMLSMGVPIK